MQVRYICSSICKQLNKVQKEGDYQDLNNEFLLYVCAQIRSTSKGWLNPPLRYNDEPCRHKVLDLIGDVSLLAREGNQGLLVAHIVAYKVRYPVLSKIKYQNFPCIQPVTYIINLIGRALAAH